MTTQPETARKPVLPNDAIKFLKQIGLDTVVQGAVFYRHTNLTRDGIYSIIYKDGDERNRYFLATEVKFLSGGKNPRVQLTAYINGGDFGKLDGRPGGVWKGTRLYQSTPVWRLLYGRDPIAGINFDRDFRRTNANEHYDRILQIATGQNI